MRTFIATLFAAGAKAQFGNFDYSDLDLQSLFGSIGGSDYNFDNIGNEFADAGLSDVGFGDIDGAAMNNALGDREVDPDDARYASAAVQSSSTSSTSGSGGTTQTAVTITGDGCWKCDEMSYLDCALNGRFVTCSEDESHGDSNACFVEVREQRQQLTQLCTGCKDREACHALVRQNFVPGDKLEVHGQCKTYNYQVARRRHGGGQSVCRQCFNLCGSTNPENCFGGLQAANTAAANADPDNGKWFSISNTVGAAINTAMLTDSGHSSPFTAWLSTSQFATTNMLGIPTTVNRGITGDSYVDATTSYLHFGLAYSSTTPNEGKSIAAGTTEMSYYPVQGQPKNFWTLSTVRLQNFFQCMTANSGVSGEVTQSSVTISLLDINAAATVTSSTDATWNTRWASCKSQLIETDYTNALNQYASLLV